MSRREFPTESQDFLRALGANLAESERLITCGIPGDPGLAEPSAWRPRPWSPMSFPWSYPTGWNAYVTVGMFSKAPDGSFRRRAALCTGGAAFMIDDVGTKVDEARVKHAQPSARVLTSPGNEQWWYFLDKPERDIERFDALIRAFIDGVLGGADPGMASITRVGRIPGFSNCKPQYGGAFDVKLTSLTEKRFSVEEILALYDINLIGRRRPLTKILPDDAEERVKLHYIVRKFLRSAKMIKRDDPDRAGWTEITCPWVDGHTHGVNNGAAIREPEIENGFYGGFRCHHGSCANRGWRDLTDWVADEAASRLEMINAGTNNDHGF